MKGAAYLRVSLHGQLIEHLHLLIAEWQDLQIWKTDRLWEKKAS